MRAALAAFLLAALAACSQPVEEESIRSTTEQGPPRCEPVVFEDTPLTHCTADPRLHRVITVLGREDGEPYRSLEAMADDRPGDAPAVAFAMNGGMFDDEGRPIGYYVSSRRRLTVLNQNDGPGNFHLKPNGVFFGTGEEWRVLDSETFAAEVTRRPDFATQSGPMLVIDGELHEALDPDGQSLRIRNGVGVDESGRAHFIISDEPISFGKLARYFRDVAKTPNALYLDGTVSGLWDPANDRIDGRGSLGPLIVVEKRARAGQ